MSDACNYDPNTQYKIQIIYVIAIIFWLILIVILQLYLPKNTFLFIILLIPLIVFIINFFNVKCYTLDMDGEMFKGDFMLFASILLVVFISWHDKPKHGPKMFRVLMVSLVLTMLSLIDIWVSKENLILVKHVRSVLQTLVLTLLIYALFLYYTDFILSNKPEIKTIC